MVFEEDAEEDNKSVIDSWQGIHAPDAITKSTMLLSERPKNFKTISTNIRIKGISVPEEHCLRCSVRVLRA